MSELCNSAKILHAYMKLSGISSAKQLAETLNVNVRTIRRLKLEIAVTADEDETVTGGRADTVNAVTGGREKHADNGLSRIEARARLKETPSELSFKTEVQKERDMFETDVSNVSPPPRKRSKGKRRFAYTVEFEAFWTNYPDTPGTSKAEAFAEWLHLLPAEQELATTSLGKFRADVSARKQRQADFRAVHACRYLSQRRWESYQTAQIITLPKAPVPTRPVNNHRDEGISLEDALARKLITEEQYAKYRSQVPA